MIVSRNRKCDYKLWRTVFVRGHLSSGPPPPQSATAAALHVHADQLAPLLARDNERLNKTNLIMGRHDRS